MPARANLRRPWKPTWRRPKAAVPHKRLKSTLTGKTPEEIKLAGLTRVGQILDAKAATDAPSFKAWLKHVAEEVAEAASEGGFLGFGGVKVTDAERASIQEVAAALGTR